VINIDVSGNKWRSGKRTGKSDMSFENTGRSGSTHRDILEKIRRSVEDTVKSTQMRLRDWEMHEKYRDVLRD
jgi:hypothetical protein